MRSVRQPIATGRNGLRLFEPLTVVLICHRLQLVTTATLHKRPIVRCPRWLRQPQTGRRVAPLGVVVSASSTCQGAGVRRARVSAVSGHPDGAPFVETLAELRVRRVKTSFDPLCSEHNIELNKIADAGKCGVLGALMFDLSSALTIASYAPLPMDSTARSRRLLAARGNLGASACSASGQPGLRDRAANAVLTA